jgi:hypothetical protein
MLLRAETPKLEQGVKWCALRVYVDLKYRAYRQDSSPLLLRFMASGQPHKMQRQMMEDVVDPSLPNHLTSLI